MKARDAAKVLVGSISVYVLVAACAGQILTEPVPEAAAEPTSGKRLKRKFRAGEDGSKEVVQVTLTATADAHTRADIIHAYGEPRALEEIDRLLGIGFNFLEKPDMRCAIEHQVVEHIVQSVHKTQQGDEHGDAERNADSGHQRLAPARQQQEEGGQAQVEARDAHQPPGHRDA